MARPERLAAAARPACRRASGSSDRTLEFECYPELKKKKDGEPFEKYVSKRARIDENLSWPEWGARFDAFLKRADRVCSPEHFIIGGGTIKKFGRFKDALTVSTPIHVASFLNNAGIIGAAVAAAR
jgi:hypothetical protein